MDNNTLVKLKRLITLHYPRFADEIAKTKFEFNENLPFKTAATDGDTIYFDPDFLDSLDDNQKLFLTAHEFLHIKFKHMLRLVDEHGKQRDMEIWNIATDAIINANLIRDGLEALKGCVDMPDAINYTAEQYYDKLLQEKQKYEQSSNKDGNEQNNEQSNSQDKNQNDNSNQDNNTMQKDAKMTSNKQNSKQNDEQTDDQNDNEQDKGQSAEKQNNEQDSNADENQNDDSQPDFKDDHTMWKDAKMKKSQQSNQQSDKQDSQQKDKQGSNKNEQDENNENDLPNINENSEFEQNRKLRREIAKKAFNKMKNEQILSTQNDKSVQNVGSSKPVVNWQLLLRQEVDKTETIWSQRRSIAENNYAYRLEENDVDDGVETEVMLDVSGSVDEEMVKAFLRQLKTIVKSSVLKVGFFADIATKKFVEVKTDRDIDRLKIPAYVGGGTNLDAPVRAFSKKREINKIVFTDGESDDMPKKDLEKVNVIWIVYDNPQFKPCCGKVIHTNSSDFFQKNDTFTY